MHTIQENQRTICTLFASPFRLVLVVLNPLNSMFESGEENHSKIVFVAFLLKTRKNDIILVSFYCHIYNAVIKIREMCESKMQVTKLVFFFYFLVPYILVILAHYDNVDSALYCSCSYENNFIFVGLYWLITCI